MWCINLKNKTKKGRKFLYCNLQKEEITFNNCKDCANKEYKRVKFTINRKNCTKSIKGHKHKLTKATSIPMKIKQLVWERDNHKCIYCGKYVSVHFANSHYIKRSQLGLGIEENIVTACQNCHYLYDFGSNIDEMINYTREHLKSKYSDWNENKLKYKKD